MTQSPLLSGVGVKQLSSLCAALLKNPNAPAAEKEMQRYYALPVLALLGSLETEYKIRPDAAHIVRQTDMTPRGLPTRSGRGAVTLQYQYFKSLVRQFPTVSSIFAPISAS